MKIEIDSEVLKELEYIIELHKKYNTDAYEQQTEVSLLVNYILRAVADGHRRPGSWERDIVNRLGLTAECEETNEYRQGYGAQ